MQNTTSPETDHVQSSQTRLAAENMAGALPRRVGAVAGLFGSIGIVIAITAVIVATGNGLFTAPRVIASVIFGSNMTGVFPVIAGTIINLVLGTVLGYVFAVIMPPIHRTMWMVAGLLYGILAFIGSSVILLPILAPDVMADSVNWFVLLLGNMVYGFILGVAGSTYGIWWKVPARFLNE
jgi:hypothetical protein